MLEYLVKKVGSTAIIVKLRDLFIIYNFVVASRLINNLVVGSLSVFLVRVLIDLSIVGLNSNSNLLLILLYYCY